MDALDLRQLAALRAVADTGSLASAARTLGWSQPTVTHHLKGLERLVGAPIIRAAATGTTLTDTGRELLPHAEALLDRAARALDAARRHAADRAHLLRVGIFPSAAAALLPGLVRELEGGGYALSIVEAELAELRAELDGLRLDAAVVFSHTAHRSSPRRAVLFSERLRLLVRADHPLASRDEVTLADLADADWIVGADEHDPVERALVRAAREAGFTPRAVARSDDYGVVAAFVRAGFGVALVPELALPVDGAGTVSVGLADPGMVRRVELVVAEATPDTAAEALIRALRRP